MTHTKPLKRLVVLDLDNTLLDTLQLWGDSLQPLIDDFTETYGVDVKIAHDLIREAPGQYRFNDGASLAQWMVEYDPALRPRHIRLKEEWDKAGGNPIARNWLDRSAAATVFYDGVVPMLKTWQSHGTCVVIQTDAEDCAVMRRLWLLAKNATDSGELQDPADLLDLVDHIYCQPGTVHAPEYLQDVELPFLKALRQKMHCWTDRLYKPEAAHLRHIVETSKAVRAETLYVGDTHKDGLEAAALGVDFAWSRYGAIVSAKTMDLYQQVGSKAYSYGLDAVTAEMQARGVKPAVTLERSFDELNRHYAWLPR